MKFLVKYFSKIKQPIHKALIAHLGLVALHPFVDGNGRVARLLMNLILLQASYPIIIVKKEKRSDYLNALEAIQKDPTDKQFLQLMLDSLQESFDLYKELY